MAGLWSVLGLLILFGNHVKERASHSGVFLNLERVRRVKLGVSGLDHHNEPGFLRALHSDDEDEFVVRLEFRGDSVLRHFLDVRPSEAVGKAQSIGDRRKFLFVLEDIEVGVNVVAAFGFDLDFSEIPSVLITGGVDVLDVDDRILSEVDSGGDFFAVDKEVHSFFSCPSGRLV